MRRRRALIPVAILLVALLTAGCVEQPFDVSQLQASESAPGVAAARLRPQQARRAAQKARQAQAPKPGKPSKAGQQGGGRDDDTTGSAAQKGDGSRGGAGTDGASEPVAGGGGGGGGGGDGTSRQPARGDTSRPKPRQAAPFLVVGKVADEQDDVSGRSPAYADIRQLLVESNGTTARVTVAVAGGIPRALAEGEVEGIGVDFYRSDNSESDFQLFVTGNSGGWEAFLHTPQGVQAYPGRFAIGGRVLVFQLPWQALGGPKPADVGMFVDWSQERTVLNAVGNDRAPDDGRIPVNPAQ